MRVPDNRFMRLQCHFTDRVGPPGYALTGCVSGKSWLEPGFQGHPTFNDYKESALRHTLASHCPRRGVVIVDQEEFINASLDSAKVVSESIEYAKYLSFLGSCRADVHLAPWSVPPHPALMGCYEGKLTDGRVASWLDQNRLPEVQRLADLAHIIMPVGYSYFADSRRMAMWLEILIGESYRMARHGQRVVPLIAAWQNFIFPAPARLSQSQLVDVRGFRMMCEVVRDRCDGAILWGWGKRYKATDPHMEIVRDILG